MTTKTRAFCDLLPYGFGMNPLWFVVNDRGFWLDNVQLVSEKIGRTHYLEGYFPKTAENFDAKLTVVFRLAEIWPKS